MNNCYERFHPSGNSQGYVHEWFEKLISWLVLQMPLVFNWVCFKTEHSTDIFHTKVLKVAMFSVSLYFDIYLSETQMQLSIPSIKGVI